MTYKTNNCPDTEKPIFLENSSRPKLKKPTLESIENADRSPPSEFKGFNRKVLLSVWLIAVAATLVIALDHHSIATQFYGIAGSTEKTISFQYPVEIVSIGVIEGQKVQKDDLLVEVKRFDLAAELAIIDEKISEIKAQKKEETATTIAEIKSLTSQKESSLSKLDIEITKLESQLKLNRFWNNQTVKSKNASQNPARNVLVEKYNGLKNQRGHVANSYQVTIDNLKQQIANKERPDDAKLAVLNNRKIELERQANSLKVKAQFDGQIGSILYTSGEQIEKFEPIITVHSESASFIKAYIHEGVINKINIDQPVWVQSTASQNDATTFVGKVTSLGNRIVEYPLRLKRNSFVSAWGREVIIELEAGAELLLGEKVVVSLHKPRQLFEQALEWIQTSKNQVNLLLPRAHGIDSVADTVPETVTDTVPDTVPDTDSGSDLNINLDSDLAALTLKPIFRKPPLQHLGFEASGIVWDKLLLHYWLINDESNKIARFYSDHSPLDEITIPGLKVNDLESISLANDKLYLLASLSRNKSGQLKPDRRKFVELARLNNSWQVNREVDLLASLKNHFSKNPKSGQIPQELIDAILSETIDIEAHQVQGNSLVLGIKSPTSQLKESYIITISTIEKIFSDLPITIKQIASIQLVDKDTESYYRISDIFILDKSYYITGVSQSLNNTKNSGLWRYDKNSQSVSKLKSFANVKAEGVTVNRENNTIIVVFDEGKKRAALFTTFPFLTGL